MSGLCSPLNLLATRAQLEAAREAVERAGRGEAVQLSQEELWRAKTLCDSAFHPDTVGISGGIQETKPELII